MIDKRILVFGFFGLMLFFLAACGGPPTDRPWISSIQVKPEIAEKGGPVSYTIMYQNLNEEIAFPDTLVVVSYDEYLQFGQNASPFPDEINERQRKLTWKLGTLKAATDGSDGSDGSIQADFVLSAKIPPPVYELEVSAEISAQDSAGDRIRYQRSATNMIVGHPTPTFTPTTTPLPPTPTSAAYPIVSTPTAP